ncbi:hypothetical protein FHT40_002329 [Mycolicibacterium sp. BK556]|nr:hypothetical protein [Mycolicibacterium sp. BK556]MBB3632448.1 hypothetical protein [Mycolicibacterium sp. BK607]MBB3750481.1 hypothetical protein [Mycolicibacterium sp. BK634]TDO18263.1 hypothetical protein EV580_1449 [Mycobacterium sp. BK086]
MDQLFSHLDESHPVTLDEERSSVPVENPEFSHR